MSLERRVAHLEKRTGFAVRSLYLRLGPDEWLGEPPPDPLPPGAKVLELVFVEAEDGRPANDDGEREPG